MPKYEFVLIGEVSQKAFTEQQAREIVAEQILSGDLNFDVRLSTVNDQIVVPDTVVDQMNSALLTKADLKNQEPN